MDGREEQRAEPAPRRRVRDACAPGVDRGVLAADLLEHPPARPRRQPRPRHSDPRVLLDELVADLPVLQPAHQGFGQPLIRASRWCRRLASCWLAVGHAAGKPVRSTCDSTQSGIYRRRRHEAGDGVADMASPLVIRLKAEKRTCFREQVRLQPQVGTG